MSVSEDYLLESDLCATEHIALGAFELFREYRAPIIARVADKAHTSTEVMRGVELFPGTCFSGLNPSQSRVLELLEKHDSGSKVRNRQPLCDTF
jgi:hypothetical protein